MALRGLWDLLVDGICRPPRDDQYELEDLVGGEEGVFQVGNSLGLREDFDVFNKRGQRLACSHYKPANVKGKDDKLPCVIYAHCNSGSRRDAEEAVFLLIPLGITVFTVDFAGSGVSEGRWVTLGASEAEDLEAVTAYLRSSGRTSTIGLWGRSMGAVTALLYGNRDPEIAAMVLDSPFCRLTDLITEVAQQLKLPIPKYFLKRAVGAMRRSVQKRAGFDINQVAPLDVVNQCHIPALFGHGTEDSHIGIDHSRKLHNAYAGERNIIFFGGNHLTIRPEFFYITVAVFFHRQLGVQQLLEGAPPLELETLEQLAQLVTMMLEDRVNEGEEEGADIMASHTSISTSVTPTPTKANSAAAVAATRSTKRLGAEFDRDYGSSRGPSPTASSTTDMLAPTTPASTTTSISQAATPSGGGAPSDAAQAALVKQKPTHVMDMLRGRLNNNNTPTPSTTGSLKRTGTTPEPPRPAAAAPRATRTSDSWSDSDSESPTRRASLSTIASADRRTSKSGSRPKPRTSTSSAAGGSEEWKVQSRVRTAEGTVICEYTGEHPNRRYRWRVLAPDEEDAAAMLGPPAAGGTSSAPSDKSSEKSSERSSERSSAAGGKAAAPGKAVGGKSAKGKGEGKPQVGVEALAAAAEEAAGKGKKKKGKKEVQWKLQNKVRTAEGILVCEYSGGFLNREYRWRLVPFEDEATDASASATPSGGGPPSSIGDGSTSPGTTDGGYSTDGGNGSAFDAALSGRRSSTEYHMLRSQQPVATPKKNRKLQSGPAEPMMPVVASAAFLPDPPASNGSLAPIKTPSLTDRQAPAESSDELSSQPSASSPMAADEDRVLLENVLVASGVAASAQSETGVSEAALQLYHTLHPNTLMSLVQLHQAVSEQDGDDPASVSALLLPTIREKEEDALPDRDQKLLKTITAPSPTIGTLDTNLTSSSSSLGPTLLPPPPSVNNPTTTSIPTLSKPTPNPSPAPAPILRPMPPPPSTTNPSKPSTISAPAPRTGSTPPNSRGSTPPNARLSTPPNARGTTPPQQRMAGAMAATGNGTNPLHSGPRSGPNPLHSAPRPSTTPGGPPPHTPGVVVDASKIPSSATFTATRIPSASGPTPRLSEEPAKAVSGCSPWSCSGGEPGSKKGGPCSIM